jgi:PAS domain S-box-containing protein
MSHHLSCTATKTVVPHRTSFSQDSPPSDRELPARQREAILAFGRRAVSRPNVTVLTQDAAALVAEMLQTGMVGYISDMGDQQFTLLLSSATFDLKSDRRTLYYQRSEAASLAGRAMETALPVVCEDLKSDASISDPQLVELGLSAAVAVPLQLHGDTLGVLAVFSLEARTFSVQEILFAETIAHLLATTIARVKAEQSLHDAQTLLDAVVNNTDTCVVVMGRDGRIKQVNKCCEQWSGVALEELQDRPYWNTFVAADELAIVRGAFQAALSGAPLQKFESWFQPQSGTARRVSSSPGVRRNPDGIVEEVVFSGADITHAVELENRARRLAKENERARRAIEELKQQVEELAAIASSRIEAARPASAERVEGRPWLHNARPFEKIPHEPVEVEHRSSPRRAYPYFQKIAPAPDARLPAREQFREVPCRDISSGGLSFLLWYEPDFQHLVVELGRGRRVARLSAEVVWFRRVRDGDSYSFLVGCKFTGRVAENGPTDPA